MAKLYTMQKVKKMKKKLYAKNRRRSNDGIMCIINSRLVNGENYVKSKWEEKNTEKNWVNCKYMREH